MQKMKPRNLSGMMGKRSPQPAKQMNTLNPLARLDQRMMGRMGGKTMTPKRKKGVLYG